MKTNPHPIEASPFDPEELSEKVAFHFNFNRRNFVQLLSTGLLVAANVGPALAQRSRGGGGGGRPRNIGARIHIGKDGIITVMAGKVEMGQGARAELTQAAAEELFVTPSQIQMNLSDTGLVPDDGNTAGSGTSPRTVPAIRQAAAAAFHLLIQTACQEWNVEPATVKDHDGKITHTTSKRSLSYSELAQNEVL